jgi:hypothetical protein
MKSVKKMIEMGVAIVRIRRKSNEIECVPHTSKEHLKGQRGYCASIMFNCATNLQERYVETCAN